MVEVKIYEYLISTNIAEHLTQYMGAPAIFLQEAPADTDSGWKKGNQYGRLVFGIDYTDSPDRAKSANMWVDIYQTKKGVAPEELAPVVMDLLDNRFFSDGVETIALSWQNTGSFQETKSDTQINGVTINFSVQYFPLQLTTTPDPIVAMNQWTKDNLIGALVIGADEQPDSWTPSETPTIYWRLANLGGGTLYPDTYHSTRHTATISGHIMIADMTTRQQVCKHIVDVLGATEVVIMDDSSPMFILRITYNSSSDAMRSGQISVTAEYGVLRKYAEAIPLNIINKEMT